MPIAGSETQRLGDSSMQCPDRLLADLGLEACDQELADQRVEAVRGLAVRAVSGGPGSRTAGWTRRRRRPDRSSTRMARLEIDRRQDRRPASGSAGARREAGEDLLGEEVVQVAARCVELRDEGARVVLLLQAGPDEGEQRRPALGSVVEIGDDVLVQRVVVGVAEEAFGLIDVEAQVLTVEPSTPPRARTLPIGIEGMERRR